MTHFVVPQFHLSGTNVDNFNEEFLKKKKLCQHLHAFSNPVYSLRVALASTVEHLVASRDWRETGHLRTVSPSSVIQKNWNLLSRQNKTQGCSVTPPKILEKPMFILDENQRIKQDKVCTEWRGNQVQV